MERYCQLSILKLKIFLAKRPLDLYVRLSENKYVKVSSKDNPNAGETLDSYSQKGLNSLYVRIEDFNELMVDIEANIHQNNSKFDDYSSMNEQYDGITDLLEDTKSIVINLGINEATCKHVDNLVQKTIYSFSKWDSIQTLSELLFKKDDYIKSHAVLCSFISSTVLRNIDWCTEAILRKVVMASLFQNIFLDKDIQAKIYNRNSEEFHNLESFDRDKVLLHTHKAAKLLDYGEFTGFEVASMVKNHHELPGEGGFPRGQGAGAKLAPLEGIFVISTYFSHTVLTCEEKNFDINRGIQDLNEIFYEGNFKKSYEYFLKVFR